VRDEIRDIVGTNQRIVVGCCFQNRNGKVVVFLLFFGNTYIHGFMNEHHICPDSFVLVGRQTRYDNCNYLVENCSTTTTTTTAMGLVRVGMVVWILDSLISGGMKHRPVFFVQRFLRSKYMRRRTYRMEGVIIFRLMKFVKIFRGSMPSFVSRLPC
jgi:hypothetical protein